MDVPVDARARGEAGVDLGEERAREDGREDGLDGLVEEIGAEDFVDVIRESRELETGCEGLGQVAEKGRWRRNEVEHGVRGR